MKRRLCEDRVRVWMPCSLLNSIARNTFEEQRSGTQRVDKSDHLQSTFASFLFLLFASFSPIEGQSSPRPSFRNAVIGSSSKTFSPSRTSSSILASRSTNIPTTVTNFSAPPTVSPFPSSFPTIQGPTSRPTFVSISSNKRRYEQSFVITNVTFFSDSEVLSISNLYSSFTNLFAPNISAEVTTSCEILSEDQSISSPVVDNKTVDTNELSFTCGYESRYENTTLFPDKMLAFLNDPATRDNITSFLQDLGLPVQETLMTIFVVVKTPSPTGSLVPSHNPSFAPTITLGPTLTPTTLYRPTSRPTDVSLSPTAPPISRTNGQRHTFNVPLIASVTILAGVAVLVGLVIYYRKTQKQRTPFRLRSRRSERIITNVGRNATAMTGAVGVTDGHIKGDFYDARVYQNDVDLNAVVSPNVSIVSNQSLISGGSQSDDESINEVDGTKNLQDEFDQYKDQNLEHLRSNVEGNLSGFEGIMSAAVTKALMGDEDAKMDPNELFWGCNDNPTGEQVEASALCDVNDWMKRNESTPMEQKRVFMQNLLNKMVASVRYGVLGAEDASRTIHESAALLGLQIANELPMTTVIISGMRKIVQTAEMIMSLREFGDIDTAAVASGERGFGIVRFRHSKSVELAMQKYRKTEVVVQDVAIQLKVLMPSGEVQSRA